MIDEVRALRVEVATLTRERDALKEALAAANARADAAEAELATLRAEFKSTVLFQNAKVTEHEEALAAARRECERLKESLREALAASGHDPACLWNYCMCWQRKARAALAAPAAAAGEEGTR